MVVTFETSFSTFSCFSSWCQFWLAEPARQKRAAFLSSRREEKKWGWVRMMSSPHSDRYIFFFFSWESCTADKKDAESKIAVAIQFSMAQGAATVGQRPALPTIWCHCVQEKRHLNTSWLAIVQPVSRSPPPPSGISLSIISKNLAVEGKGVMQASSPGDWILKTLQEQSKEEKKRRREKIESWKFKDLVWNYTKRPHPPR